MILKRKKQIPTAYILAIILTLAVLTTVMIIAYMKERKNLFTIKLGSNENPTIVVDNLNVCIDTGTNDSTGFSMNSDNTKGLGNDNEARNDYQKIIGQIPQIQEEIKVKLTPEHLTQEMQATRAEEFRKLIQRYESNPTKENSQEIQEAMRNFCHLTLNKDPMPKYKLNPNSISAREDFIAEPNYNSNEASNQLSDSLSDSETQSTEQNPIASFTSPVHTEYYVIATQLRNPHNQISSQQLREAVENHSYKTFPVIWDNEADAFLQAQFQPGNNYKTFATSELLERLENSSLSEDPTEWFYAIIPFEKLNPTVQIVEIADNPIFSNSFQIDSYQLVSSYQISTNPTEQLDFTQYKQFEIENLQELFKKHLEIALGPANFESSKTFSLAITGKSTIGAGIQSPPDATSKNLSPVLPILNSTDAVVINNESPLTDDCEIYDIPTQYLCGKPESLRKLKDQLSSDLIIDAAGYDIFDFGREGFADTLENYSQNQIKYFAAGKNNEEAQSPIKITHTLPPINIGLLGYDTNPLYAGYIAGPNYAGNAGTYGNITKSISKLASETDYTIIDIHNPFTYSNDIELYNLAPTRSFIDVGADLAIVVNTPTVKPMELYNDKMIFYGIGNFLTAEVGDDSEREALIVKLNFYDNSFIGYQLFPIYIGDSGQITIAEDSKKLEILNKIYKNRP